jgi:hypothetical protein
VDQIKEGYISGAAARMGKMRNSYKILIRKPEGRQRWENNFNIDLRQVVCGGVDGIHLAQDSDRWRALVNTIMNLRVQ